MAFEILQPGRFIVMFRKKIKLEEETAPNPMQKNHVFQYVDWIRTNSSWVLPQSSSDLLTEFGKDRLTSASAEAESLHTHQGLTASSDQDPSDRT